MRKEYVVTLLVVFIIWFKWQYVIYIYNSLTLDPDIKILTNNKTEEVTEYDELLSNNILIGKPCLVLFNNGWTKDRLLKLDHSRVYANCEEEGWNLVYLSNEFGDQEYNRTRVNWLNRICEKEMFGFHLYPLEPFELFDKYILKRKTQTGENYSFPHAFIMNSGGVITDTLYNYQDKEISSLLE